MNKHIFWISSYPKSGNTLLRTFLASLFFSDDGSFNFDMLKNIPIIEDTANVEFVKKIEKKDFTNLHKLETISKYWLKLQEKKNLGFDGDFMFVKTHHALIKLFNNPFTNNENTRGIIYVVRDPRDVVLSMCNHFNLSIKNSINLLLDDNFCLRWKDSKGIFKTSEKPLSMVSSWKNHYISWNESSFNCPKLIIKFEDMVCNKRKVIKKLINFFEINYGFKFSNLDLKIQNIVDQTDFKNLQNKEKSLGFKEAVNNNFFNIGKANQWMETLSEKDIRLIEKNCFYLLKKLKYNIKLDHIT